MRVLNEQLRKEVLEQKILIGRKINFHRKAQGKTRKFLGDGIGRTPQTIYNIEQGMTGPTVIVLSKICKLLNITLDHLFYGEIEDSYLLIEQQRADLFLRARKESGMTRTELAELSNIDRAYIYRLENMGVQIIDEQISTLCAHLGITGNALLNGVSPRCPLNDHARRGRKKSSKKGQT